jgi:hypothetical protein
MQNQAWLSRCHSIVAAPVRGLDLLFWSATGLMVFLVSIVFNMFGLFYYEISEYICYHLGSGPVWVKIFNSRVLDHGIYEGRELSYLIDHLDVLAVALSVKSGFPLFISITHVVLSVFTGVWLSWFAAKDLKLGSLIGFLLALLFWTTPYLYLHFVFRTAKILAAAALVVLITEVVRALKNSPDRKTPSLPLRFIASIGAAAFVLSFSDRQGVFFLAITCAIAAFCWLAHKNETAGRIFLLLSSVLALELVYFFWIAPPLTQLFFGYAPDFSYNRLPLGEILGNFHQFLGKSLDLLADTLCFTLGQLPRWQLGLVLAAILFVSLFQDIRNRSWREKIPLSGLIIFVLSAIWAMDILMISRHPPLLWADLRRVYYWIPTGAVIVLGVASVLSRCVDQTWKKMAVAAILLGLVFQNVAALPEHQKTLAAGHLGYCMAIGPNVRDALMHRDSAGYIVSPDVKKIPAYHVLLEYAPQP